MNKKNKRLKKVAIFTEARKPLIIAVISIVTVLVLFLLVIFAPTFVGKAYFVPGDAGVEQISPVNAGEPFTVTVKANIGTKGTETVAVGFILEFPSELKVLKQKSLLGWSLDNGATLTDFYVSDNSLKPSLEPSLNPSSNKLIFEYATINTDLAKTGEFDIAAITFDGALPGTYVLHFPSFDVIDLNSHMDVIKEATDTTIKVVKDAGCIPKPEICNDGVDNDCDLLTDCADSDCQIANKAGADICWEYTCNDGIDNDRSISITPEGDIDCVDSDCAGQLGPKGVTCCQNDLDCVTGSCKNNICVEVTSSELPSVTGVKIILTELSAATTSNLITFNTEITAIVDLTPFKLITQLEDAATPGVVLLYKTETISAMTAGETKIIQTIYQPEAGVAQIIKKVIVYDQQPGDTLECGKLEHTHLTS
jgi:hypothetical protein